MTTNTHTTRFTIGARVDCSDGLGGELLQVVIDPIARAVTHLVVGKPHGTQLARLVPLDLAEPPTDAIRLGCTVAEFADLDAAEERHFLAGSDAFSDYAEDQALMWPYYFAVGTGRSGYFDLGPSAERPGQAYISDSLPAGEVGVRRGDRVQALDGGIGRVQGVVIEDPGHTVTHVLLKEGHPFGRKDVAIPISVVTSVDDGIELSLTKQQVHDLPAVGIQQHGA